MQGMRNVRMPTLPLYPIFGDLVTSSATTLEIRFIFLCQRSWMGIGTPARAGTFVPNIDGVPRLMRGGGDPKLKNYSGSIPTVRSLLFVRLCVVYWDT